MNVFHHFYARLAVVFLIVTLSAITGIYFYFEKRAAAVLHDMVAEETVWFDNETAGLKWGNEADRSRFMQAFRGIATNRNLLQMLVTGTDREEIFYYRRDSGVRKLVPGVDIGAPENPGDMKYHLMHRDSGYELVFSVFPRSIRGKSIVWAVLPLEKAFAEQIESTALTAVSIVLITVLLIALTILPLVIRSCRTVELHWRDLQRSYLSTIQTLGRTIAKRDQRTNKHNFRVAYYALRLGEKLELPRENLRSLILGAVLHDIGKIGIPDHILLKPGKLNAEELEMMQSHVVKGLEILENIDWLQQARAVIGAHHERFDGNGYPEGIRGEHIVIEARVFAVVDVFDALICDRPYKKARPMEAVLAHLENGSTTHFDPDVVRVFIGIASDLYRDIGKLSEEELQLKLQEAAAKHFPELMVI